ncbi:MAG: polymer-forming cytoskeletal protein [Gemmatimonadetes bacterium]|nr:polymer-forming cytoskeletal protein [Gemmatimonadota bacterium]MCC6769663.1 polymer-forming cytoskeletal protein [Gemmatimonadaceae bacterium]
MALFNKPAERPVTRLDAAGAESSMSVIGSGMRITGDIESNGVIKVEGTIEGAVRGARQLLLGKGGTIHGDIFAIDAILGGTVVGTVVASERVEIQGTSSVEGDIHTKSMVVFEGGMINGSVRMGEHANLAQSPPASASEDPVGVAGP